ncbi:MAG: DUF402 domain-containing protein [Aggregatilineales bacterium]
MADTRTVIKRDHQGGFVWQYEGEVVERGAKFICIQARFNRDIADIGVMVFRRDDLMTEWFYADRWYNVFKVQDASGERLKGYYCNVTRPAEITDETIAADDLALDVFVSPAGEIILLDEDEFAELPLNDNERQAALDAVEKIRTLVKMNTAPFTSG